MRRAILVLPLLVGFASGLTAQVIPFGSHLTPGANSRGYVAPQIGTSTQFTAPCATRGFLPGFDFNTMKIFDPGNATFDASLGCAQSGWSGTSIMYSEPGLLRSYTSVSVTDPASMGGATKILALARTVFLDAVYFSSGGPVPDTAHFTFNLDGTVNNTLGTNAIATPTASFTMAWDSDVAPGLSQGIVTPSGIYDFAFEIRPDMLDRWIPFSISLQTFAILAAGDPSQVFTGSATTDYSHTLRLTNVSFVDGVGSGPGVDISSSVAAQWQIGTEYPVTSTPEPGTVLLVSTGMIPLLRHARRRARR